MAKDFQNLPPLDPNQRYSIAEAMAYLRISRQKIYANINTGTLKTIRDGKRRYVPGSEIIACSRFDESTAAA